MVSLTHDELTNRAVRWLENTKRCQLVLKEARGGWSAEQPDAIGFKNRQSFLVEAKTSRSDFKKDFQKYTRHPRATHWGMGQFRYYICEPGLITIPDLPDKWGLLYVKPKIISVVKDAQPFERNEEMLLRELSLVVAEFSNYMKRGFSKSRRTY